MTSAEFKTALPVFKDIGSDVIDRWLAAAASDPNVVAVVAKAPTLCLAYWVAHQIAMETLHLQMGVTAKAGDVVSASTPTGSVSRSAALVEAQAKDDLMRTRWGQLYTQMAESSGMGGAVISATSRGYQRNGDGTTYPTNRPGYFIGD